MRLNHFTFVGIFTVVLSAPLPNPVPETGHYADIASMSLVLLKYQNNLLKTFSPQSPAATGQMLPKHLLSSVTLRSKPEWKLDGAQTAVCRRRSGWRYQWGQWKVWIPDLEIQTGEA